MRINACPYFVIIAIFSQKKKYPAVVGYFFLRLIGNRTRGLLARRRGRLATRGGLRRSAGRFPPSPPRRRGLHIVRDDFFCFAVKVISRSFRRSSFQKQSLHGRSAPRRQLRRFAVQGFIFVFSCKSRNTGHFHRVVADCISFATTFLCFAAKVISHLFRRSSFQK